jgi:hypothetical protein
MRRRRFLSSAVAAFVALTPVVVQGAAHAEGVPPAETHVRTLVDGGVGDGGPARDAFVHAGVADADPSGAIWFYDTTSRQIRRIDPGDGTVHAGYGNGATASSLPASAPNAAAVPIPTVSRIWTTVAGDLYLLGPGYSNGPADNVFRIAVDGSLTRVYGPNQVGPLSPGESNAPVFVRRDGSLLLSEVRNEAGGGSTTRIVAFAPGGTTSGTVLTTHGMANVDEADDGTLVYTYAPTGAGAYEVHRLHPDGTDDLVAGPGPQPSTTGRPDPAATTAANLTPQALGVDPAGSKVVYCDRPGGAGDTYLLRAIEAGQVRTIGAGCNAGPPVVTATHALLGVGGPIREYALDAGQAPAGGIRYGLDLAEGSGSSPDGTPLAHAFLTIRSLAADPRDGTLALGTTTAIRTVAGSDDAAVLGTLAGGGHPADGIGDGLPAREAALRPDALAYASDGRLFVLSFDAGRYRIRVIGTDGVIHTVAGGGADTADPDGKAAADVALKYGNLTVSPDGSTVYLIQEIPVAGDGHSYGYGVFALTSGVFHRVAGGAYGEPGGPALSTYLSQPTALGIDPATGRLWIADPQRLLRLEVDGTLRQVPAYPGNAFAPASDGSVYTAANAVWKRRPDGSFVVVGGQDPGSGSPPVGAAMNAQRIVRLDDHRVLVADNPGATTAVRVLDVADVPWTGPAPELRVTADSKGTAGTLHVEVTAPPALTPWHVRVRLSSTGPLASPVDGARAIDAILPAAGGTTSVDVARYSRASGTVNVPSDPVLPVDKTYDLALYATTQDGAQAPPPVAASVLVADKTKPATLTPVTPTTIRYGRSTALVVTLADSATGVGIGGQPLVLQTTDDPNSTTWRKLTTVVTTADGSVHFPVAPTRSTGYRWTYGGSDAWKAVTSAEVTVPVRLVLTVTAPAMIPLGGGITFTATLRRGLLQQDVLLQRWSNGVWVDVSTTYVPDTTAFTLSTRPPTAGGYHYRVVVANAAYATAISRTLNVTVSPTAKGASATQATTHLDRKAAVHVHRAS